MLEHAVRQGWTQRALAGAAFTARYGHLDADGFLVDAPSAPPTVAAVDLSGDAVTFGAVQTVSEGGDNADVYEAAIAASAVTEPDQLTITWTADSVDHSRVIDVVGGYLVSMYDARRRKSNRNYQSRSDDDLIVARTIVEDEAEEIMHRSMVPRARKAIVRTPGPLACPLLLPDVDIIGLRKVTATTPSGTATDYTAAQIANLHADRGGLVHRLDGSAWPSRGTLTFVYTYGLTHPPHDVAQAALRRLDYWTGEGASSMPEFTTGYTLPETGITYRFGGPGSSTGDMMVDKIYGRHIFIDPPIA